MSSSSSVRHPHQSSATRDDDHGQHNKQSDLRQHLHHHQHHINQGSGHGHDIVLLMSELLEVAVQTESYRVLKEALVRYVFRKFESSRDGDESEMLRRIDGLSLSKEDVDLISRIQGFGREHEMLIEQVILSVLGADLAAYSGIDSPYRPELLNEPFIEIGNKIELIERAEKEILREIENAIYHANISTLVGDFRGEVKAKFSKLIKHDTDARSALSPEEMAGTFSFAIEAIINKRRDYITNRLSTERNDSKSITTAHLNTTANPFTSGVSAVSISNPANIFTNPSKRHWPLFDLLAYNDVIETVNPADITSLCDEMHGFYLNSALRRTLWMYRLLYCYLDNPNRDVSYVSELHRMATAKRIPATLFESNSKDYSNLNQTLLSSSDSFIYNPSTHHTTALGTFLQSRRGQSSIVDIEDLINRLIKHYIYLGLYRPGNNQVEKKSDEAVDLSAYSVLIRKASYLIYSFYVTSGQVTHRSVIISLLLLHVFGDLSPTCEIVLRMQHRIILEVLPSHLLAKTYCIQSVAAAALAELFTQDRELYSHIQNCPYLKSKSSSSTTFSSSSSSSSSSTAADVSKILTSEEQLQGDSVATILLFGWLDCGYWGWFREHTVLYLWDVILTSGSSGPKCTSDSAGNDSIKDNSSNNSTNTTRTSSNSNANSSNGGGGDKQKESQVPVISPLNNIAAMQNFFSRLCCVLLLSIRADIIAAGTSDKAPLVDALQSAGRQVKTKTIVAAVNAAIASGYLHV